MQLLHRFFGDERINYWGFSYGTVLGSTYADMFPEDVNRFIIDGVVDVPNYYKVSGAPISSTPMVTLMDSSKSASRPVPKLAL